jgi:hypothetical protein
MRVVRWLLHEPATYGILIPMRAFDWTCPFCDRPATITDQSVSKSSVHLKLANKQGNRFSVVTFIVCPNRSCKQFTLEVTLHEEFESRWQGADGVQHVDIVPGKVLSNWRLVPFGQAKEFANYIPQAIISDYREACLIADLSPKASATLSRRCLQGMIRDFWNVRPGRLIDEIAQIETQVEPLTWDAIDAVRKVGNIGAHMERDVNIIVDVEPNEAKLLIGLIELLLKEWYVNREERRKRLEDIKQLATKKQNQRKP